MFRSEKLIRFHHCDPAGIVFYPQYFVLFNELVEDWFEHGLGTGFAKLHMERRLGIPMVHVECDFLAPSRIGEKLDMRLTVTKVGRTSLALAVSAVGEGGAERVRAKLVTVMTHSDTHSPEPIPADLRAAIERFVRPAPDPGAGPR